MIHNLAAGTRFVNGTPTRAAEGQRYHSTGGYGT